MVTKHAPYMGERGYGFTQAMQRARLPYRNKNVITGVALFGFVASVYYYSVAAVKQDDFDDIPLPPAPEKSEK
ncbi:hypothetical protein K493DRAFT_316208 [Basidiobolus meristosporus CBS 931.73]|uniref:Cytochrome c oxidase assembly factor 3 n=1 Tax=Basidiobolus meristosporus CBS 931.73 TaxID=1314790 RepID=A0A1Y1Y4S6_9FUNG|nr:hypothetical protein K493DRAFT_316208 [Basidiobolus meristosporus CBS 931.73]|eukprot:ORX93032.1 hypothetical protein K493DRAFT_316208 [Basidiobolus meristosporus CBS 931.73]